MGSEDKGTDEDRPMATAIVVLISILGLSLCLNVFRMIAFGLLETLSLGLIM